MGNLSTHFSRSEFACKCGCGGNTVDAEMLMLCEDVRRIEKGPVIVSSGFRCYSHNEQVKGSSNSQHLYGRAADLLVSDPRKIYDTLCCLYPRKYGFGLYSTFIHVDSRSHVMARWREE